MRVRGSRQTTPLHGAGAALVLLISSMGGAAAVAQVPLLLPPPTPSAAGPTPTATAVPTGSVEIQVTLVRGRERLPGHDSVAWVPAVRPTPASVRRVEIAQRDKQFVPRIAIATVGSTVDFPNYDRVFHNVFSLSSPRQFDLGLYRRGKSKAVLFDRPGLVQVYCNIHPHMAAYLMVVDSGRHGVAGADGRIGLSRVPTGRLEIAGWNVRGGMWSETVSVRTGRTTRLEVELDITSWREVPHLNKHGKEYPSPDDNDFRY